MAWADWMWVSLNAFHRQSSLCGGHSNGPTDRWGKRDSEGLSTCPSVVASECWRQG